MPEGGQLTLKTSVDPVSTGGVVPDWVRVSVTDTGTGISEENLARIFEPLFTNKARGIGLGLALCKTLVEGHGGAISVQSEVGRGITFAVKLPWSQQRRHSSGQAR
jgi:signal transduction histidine kinase